MIASSAVRGSASQHGKLSSVGKDAILGAKFEYAHDMPRTDCTVIIPARNEQATIAQVVQGALQCPRVESVIVVDDGSQDGTADLAKNAGAVVIQQPYSKGNGAALKTGARAAGSDILVFMDGDGQHDPALLPEILAPLDQGFDLSVGARQTRQDQAGWARWGANAVYNWMASILVNHRVEDLTSGYRAVRAEHFQAILELLPNGFSSPTTTTMAFYRAGHNVTFVPMAVAPRVKDSRSHIRPLRDGLRFLTIIFKVATLYSPLKLFVPIALLLTSTGIGYYLYTFLSNGRFTNMAVLLMVSGVIVFAMGLLSEQITSLIYLSIRGKSSTANRSGVLKTQVAPTEPVNRIK